MKKIVLSLIILIIVCSSAFALSEEVSPNTNRDVYGALGSPYKSLDARSLAMGGVGIAGLDNYQSFWSNPAGLADNKVQVSTPNVGVSLYNPVALYKAYKSGLFEKIANGEINENNISEIYNDENVNKILSYGYGKIADINSNISFSFGGFGFGFAVQDSILTYLNGQITSTNIINQLLAETRVGYGLKFNFTDKFSLDIGFSVGFRYLAYNKAVDISTLLKIVNSDSNEQNPIDTIPFMAGWAIPVNVGARLNLPLGFSVASVLNNINGKFNMNAYDNYSAVLESPFNSDKKFSFNTDMTWDVGVAWDPDFSSIFKPTVEADFVDILGFVADKDLSARAWVNHLKLGAEIRGLWVFDIRGGLDSGYWTLGAGLDFYALRVEAAYYWHEFGSVAGEKGIDGLTVQVNLGW